MKIIIMMLCLLRSLMPAIAQDNYGVKGFYPKTFTVTDSATVTYNELQAGYTIKDESEKTVGKKGDFSRYKIYFYLTNTGTEAKIMYRNMSFLGHSGPINNNIALFSCLNATGARLTNKMASMALQPCKLEAMVDDKKVLADIGYWIRPGETVSKTYPMIVPLGERPKVTVTFYPEVGNQTGAFMGTPNVEVSTPQEFVHIKNFAGNNYLHIQNGPLSCSDIDNEWWSAQWEIVPVNGTNNFLIKNRWKNNYVCNNSMNMMTGDSQSANAMWMIQESGTANTFYIKNVVDNTKLYIDNGMLKVSNNFLSNDAVSKWIIEKQ